MNSFGHLLKHWRTTRRLSQLELASIADVSSRHISFLETGRSEPSRAMVLRLSNQLDVPRSTRNQMLEAAGHAASYTERKLSDEELLPVQQALSWTLENHSPYPAIVIDRHWKLIRANNSAQFLFQMLGVAEGDSLLDLMIDREKMEASLENWQEVIEHLQARLATESSHYGGDPILDDTISKIDEMLDDANYIRGRKHFPAVVSATYIAGSIRLSLFSTISQFGTAEDIALADLKIEHMFPADEESGKLLMSMAGSN